eukprot:270404_1
MYKEEECLSLFSFNIWRPYPTDGSIYSFKGMKQHFVETVSNQNWLDIQTRQRYDRPKAIHSMLTLYRNKVDIFAFQELTLPSYQIIQKSLGNGFTCIHHSSSSKREHGYPTDIFWNIQKYALLSFEYKTKQQDGKPLYWCLVRLLSKQTNEIINVISAHLHCAFYESEVLDGVNPRINDMKAIIALINKSVKGDEAVFIVGDFNDFAIPPQYFSSHKALKDSYASAFGDMRECTPYTCPTPAAIFDPKVSDGSAQTTYDWQFFKKQGINVNVEALSAKVIKFHDMGIYPSDHYPVHAIYRIKYQEIQSKL